MYYMNGADDIGGQAEDTALLTALRAWHHAEHQRDALLGDDVLGDGMLEAFSKKAKQHIVNRAAEQFASNLLDSTDGDDPSEEGQSPDPADQRVYDWHGNTEEDWSFVQGADVGIGLPSFLRRDPTRTTAGRVLMSATPQGRAAMLLRSGAVKPGHLSAAAKLTKAASGRNPLALLRIATIKRRAQRGDPAARKALGTIALAHTIQRGSRPRGLKGLHAAGLATLRR